jgi:hypothetical protein
MEESKEPAGMLSVVALILVHMTHSYLLISPFVYAGSLALHHIPNLTPSSAGYYAGYVASAFMAGRTISSYQWGKIADSLGRRSVLLLSLLLSTICSVAFGLAPSFEAAMCFRFILGFVNALPGVMITLITEFSRGDKQWESDKMGLVFGMWGLAFLIAPTISGFLADPVTQFPDSWISTTFHQPLSEFPFLLPNLFGALCCALSYVFVYFYCEETLPASQIKHLSIARLFGPLNKRDRKGGRYELVQASPRSWDDPKKRWRPPTDAEDDRGEDDYGSGGDDDDEEAGVEMQSTRDPSAVAQSSPSSPSGPEKNDDSRTALEPATARSLLSRRTTRNYLFVAWIFGFVSTVMDETVPLFALADNSGGLGLLPSAIGQLLAASGVLYVLVQYRLFKFLVRKLQRTNAMRFGTIAYGFVIML